MKRRKIVFVLLLTISLIRPYPNMVNGNTEPIKTNVSKTFLADGLCAKTKGEKRTNVEKGYGVKHTVNDIFIEKQENTEKHLREDILEVNLDEMAQDSKLAKQVQQKYGLNVVYAGEDLTMTRKKSDSSGTAKIKITVNYTVSTYKNQEYVNITKASGKITACSGSLVRFGSGVSVVSNKYTVGQYGFTKTSG